MLVKALRFVLFVAEILHCFIVDQAVDGARVCLGVHLVHGAAKHHAPFCDQQRVHDVYDKGCEGDHRKPWAVFAEQDDRHQRDFQQCRQNIEQQKGEQKAYPARAAFNVARHAAGLPVQMKAQAEAVQMGKHLQRNPPDRTLRDLGKYRVAQLAKQRAEQAQQAIGNHQHHRQGQCRLRMIHRIDNFLQRQRHRHVGELGQHQQRDGQRNAPLEFKQIGQQRAYGVPLGAFGRIVMGGMAAH